MKIITAECSGAYNGHIVTTFAPARRVILLKDDGSVVIHSDKGTDPVSYMPPRTRVKTTQTEGARVMTFKGHRGSSLTLELTDIITDHDITLDTTNAGVLKGGTEDDLQAWLAERMNLFGPGVRLIQREYPVGRGRVDLLAEDDTGRMIVIEVKLIAKAAATDQLSRYVHGIQKEFPDREVVGVLAAPVISRGPRATAEERGFSCVEVPPDWQEEYGEVLRNAHEAHTESFEAHMERFSMLGEAGRQGSQKARKSPSRASEAPEPVVLTEMVQKKSFWARLLGK